MLMTPPPSPSAASSHDTKFIIIYLRQSGEGEAIEAQWGDIIQRHSLGFYRKLIFLPTQKIKITSRKSISVTVANFTQIHSVLFFIFFTINYFLRKGSIKKFMSNKDTFIAEKIWLDWAGELESVATVTSKMKITEFFKCAYMYLLTIKIEK